MKNPFVTFTFTILFTAFASGAPKPHLVVLGRWTTIKWIAEESLKPESLKPESLKIRPIYVDGHIKEYAVGATHEVTDRIFLLQRMFRLNDSLPGENGQPRWRWERGGWLAVDRVSGKVQAINLPDFDSYDSNVAWFRDYAAYCGFSDDGKKAFAVIVQLGRRKPVLRKPLASSETLGCGSPTWQRDPVRATFDPAGEQKFTFSVRSHSVDLIQDEESATEEQVQNLSVANQ